MKGEKPAMVNCPYAHIVSLGHRCAVAWQIGRYFRINEHYFFDWLITPFESVIMALERRFKNFASLDSLRVVELPALERFNIPKSETVLESRYGIALHHDFPRVDSHIDPAAVAQIHAEVLGKYTHKAEKLLSLISSSKGPVLFIRSEGNFRVVSEAEKAPMEPRQLDRFMTLVRKLNPSLDFDVLLVNVDSFYTRYENVRFDKARSAPPGYWAPIDAWRGYSEDWNLVFARTKEWRRKRDAMAASGAFRVLPPPHGFKAAIGNKFFSLYEFNDVVLKGRMGVPEKNGLAFDSLALGYAKSSCLPQAFNQPPVSLKGSWMPLFGYVDNDFYHFATELLPRVILAELQGLDCGFILPPEKDAAFAVEFMEALGVPRSRWIFHPGADLHVERCYFQQRFYGCDLTRDKDFLAMLRSRLLACAKRPAGGGGKRIYISSEGRPCRRVKNESAFHLALSRFGFEKVSLESLPLAERIGLMSECSAVVFPHGVESFYLAFMPRGSLAVELFNPNFVNHAGLAIASSLGHRLFHSVTALEPGDYPVSVANRTQAKKLDIMADIEHVEQILQSSLRESKD